MSTPNFDNLQAMLEDEARNRRERHEDFVGSVVETNIGFLIGRVIGSLFRRQ